MHLRRLHLARAHSVLGRSAWQGSGTTDNTDSTDGHVPIRAIRVIRGHNLGVKIPAVMRPPSSANTRWLRGCACSRLWLVRTMVLPASPRLRRSDSINGTAARSRLAVG